MDTARYAELFLTESREQLSTVNDALLRLERDADATSIDLLFRAMHSVKGMSAAMGYADVTELSHEAETLLAMLRSGTVQATPAAVALLFDAADELERSIDRVVAGDTAGAMNGALIARLRAFCRAGDEASAPSIESTPAATRGDGMLVRVRIAADAELRGVRAYIAVQKAAALGTVVDVSPPLEVLQQGSYGEWFSLLLATPETPAHVERAILAAGDVTAVEVRDAGSEHTAPPGDAPAAAATTDDERAARRTTNVRIDLKRLDALMNLIGELVIARGRLAQVAGDIGDAALDDVTSECTRLIGALQAEIVTSRMVPVGQIFDRLPRLVRDAARTLGKQVDFVMEGREIELDRSLLDEIGEPLVHLLRNAVDHGVEHPERRVAAGKTAAGRVTLAAARDRSSVLVTVTDDDGGVDRERVLDRARAAGAVEPGRTELTDADLFRLVATPGFSTAREVTDISGRGVGMDAVHSRVRAIGGALEMSSRTGEGTRVTLRLPLTLAIVRALIARVGDERYAVPLTHVRETLSVSADMIATLRGREVMMLRDDVFPVLRLRGVVGLPADDASADAEAIVVEAGGRRAAVIVDACVGQQEVVVKQFDAVRGALMIFGGATILGDGAPALIIDAASLLQRD